MSVLRNSDADGRQLPTFSTPGGLLLHGIMSSIAELYSRNSANEVTKGMEQKVKTGGAVHKAPVGYDEIDLRLCRCPSRR